MKLKIIDASVAIKWFVDEPNRKEAMDLLSQIEQNPRQFGVPELFFNEMLSVFCKLALSEKEIVSFMHCLQNLGFHRIGNGSELIEVAVHIASRYRISGYDAIYAATAKLTSGVWITADKDAHRKLKDRGLSQCL